MREVDKNSAVKPMSDPARAAPRQYEAAAVARGRKGEGLYFPVNLDDEAIVAGTEPPAGRDTTQRDACIFLLIPETRPPSPDGRRSEDNVSEGSDLYFPVNSRRGTATQRGRAALTSNEAPERDCLYFPVNSKDEPGGRRRGRLQIVADSTKCAPSAERGRLLRERAATA